ncbi:MAG TPA: ATP-binding protein, partial [Pricia sp.]|nr:ATP-binding protein [Pricia sp.]
FVSSHDLQEPLRKIQTFANLIQDSEVDNLSQRGKEYFGGIGRAATRMRHILKDLLSYSETREDHYSFETVDLKPLVERAASRLREELTNSGASLTIAEMCHIDIVPVQIEQVFYNLLSNAVAFRSPERRLSIDISSTVYMGAQSELSDLVPEKDYLEISVSDNGKGFDQRYADKIFDMFQRLETKNTDRSTGIGLAIAKKIVLDHQGKIIASGEVGKGATIKCYLPLRQ